MKRNHLGNSKYLTYHITYLPEKAADYLFKPTGLWYSMSNEWQLWCEKNKIDISTQYKYIHELNIDFKSICVLDSIDTLMDFHWKYSYKHESVKVIDWKKVMIDYDGIEIRNYEALLYDSLSRGIIWLRNWEVNSGCIWHLQTVEFKNSHLIK